PLPVLLDAVNRGVHLDVGHGNASFSFKVAEAAKRHGIAFNTISTDIYRKNRIHGPVYSMAHVLSKFLYLGYP
ncbi:amidohydrolase/deacetylase family metallohydrolase, partial [Bacillus pseudomycoides]